MKKYIFFWAAALLCSSQLFAQGMAVNSTGTAADNSAVLDASSTTQGMLVPRMLQSQRTSISNPATGLLVYQTDAPAGFYYNSGTPASPSWISLSSGSPTGAAGGALSGTYPNPALSTTATTGNSIVTALGSATTGTIPVGRLGTGSATGTTYLDGSGAWSSPAPGGTAGGDLTGSYPSPTLKTTGVSSGTYGSASSIPQLTVDTKGRITTITTVNATGGGGGGAVLQVVATITAGTSTSSIPVSNTPATALNYNNVTTNVSSQFDGTTFTAASAGLYLIKANFTGSTTGGNKLMAIKIGTTIVDYGTTSANSSNLANQGATSITSVQTLTAGQALTICTTSGAAISPVNTDGSCKLTIVKLN